MKFKNTSTQRTYRLYHTIPCLAYAEFIASKYFPEFQQNGISVQGKQIVVEFVSEEKKQKRRSRFNVALDFDSKSMIVTSRTRGLLSRLPKGDYPFSLEEDFEKTKNAKPEPDPIVEKTISIPLEHVNFPHYAFSLRVRKFLSKQLGLPLDELNGGVGTNGIKSRAVFSIKVGSHIQDFFDLLQIDMNEERISISGLQPFIDLFEQKIQKKLLSYLKQYFSKVKASDLDLVATPEKLARVRIGYNFPDYISERQCFIDFKESGMLFHFISRGLLDLFDSDFKVFEIENEHNKKTFSIRSKEGNQQLVKLTFFEDHFSVEGNKQAVEYFLTRAFHLLTDSRLAFSLKSMYYGDDPGRADFCSRKDLITSIEALKQNNDVRVCLPESAEIVFASEKGDNCVFTFDQKPSQARVKALIAIFGKGSLDILFGNLMVPGNKHPEKVEIPLNVIDFDLFILSRKRFEQHFDEVSRAVKNWDKVKLRELKDLILQRVSEPRKMLKPAAPVRDGFRNGPRIRRR